MNEFPKWKYHKVEDAKIVESKEEESALGKEWGDSPADFGVETCPSLVPDADIAKNAKASAKKKSE